MVYYKAYKIKSKYKISNKSDVDFLILILRKLNCNVCKYSEERMKLAVLHLTEEARTAHALSVTDENDNTTIYYNDKLSAKKQQFALAHEMGHFVLGHRHKKGSAKQEADADKFAQILLSSQKQYINTLIFSAFCLILAVILLLFSINAIFLDSSVSVSNVALSENTTPHSDVCYYTKYGTVYHIYKDCYYLKNSKEVYTGTIDSCELDRLCSACERRKETKGQ